MNNTWWVDPSELDDDQEKVVQLGIEGNYLVLGPPGSGKTNLLLLRANYLCSADIPNVKILVFTRTLREFLASGASGYFFQADKIQTYNSWAKSLLWEYGIDHEVSDDFSDERDNLIKALQNLISSKGLSNLFDTILLDEAHDYKLEEFEIFLKLGAKLFAVADSRQQIYRMQESVGFLREQVDDTFELKYHYRNGINICKLADTITKVSDKYEPLVNTSNYNESAYPSTVRHYKFPSLEEQCQTAIAEVENQIAAYPNELIGIICPRHEELSQIRSILSNSDIGSSCTFQDSEIGYSIFTDPCPVCVCSLHSSKGLEFRTLHMMSCETLKKFPLNRNMAFTGITRAKTSLSIYYSADLPGYLESALKSLSPRQDLPSISEAFGRSK